jgi:serine/threonine protein kinase
LTSDFFKLRHETSNGTPGTTLPDSDILIALGNYVSRGQRIVSDFVCETKSHENDFKFLSAKLSKDSLEGQEGVLPVLGYRQPLQNLPDGTKMFQLVFELPTGLDRNSLSHLLHTRPGPDLVERLALCRKLAVATKTIHSIGLVHKALRARSILILSASGAPLSTAKAYLQDWTCAREVSGTTAELGEGVWQKRIYQHPERQGEYAEAAYEPRHDIYSLGVCMLEVLLWTPFVVTDTPSPVKELKVCDLFQQYGFARRMIDGGLPERFRGDLAKMTSRPWITKTIWQDVADAELGNPDLAQLISQCLEGSFMSASDVDSRLTDLMVAPGP